MPVVVLAGPQARTARLAPAYASVDADESVSAAGSGDSRTRLSRCRRGRRLARRCAGFVERVRIGPGHREQLSFGEGSLIVADVGHGRSAPTGEESSQSVMLRVDDVAALCDRVRKHGGEIVREPRDFSYGGASAPSATPPDIAGRSPRPCMTSHPRSGAALRSTRNERPEAESGRLPSWFYGARPRATIG